jgi:hypothetical protein
VFEAVVFPGGSLFVTVLVSGLSLLAFVILAAMIESDADDW